MYVYVCNMCSMCHIYIYMCVCIFCKCTSIATAACNGSNEATQAATRGFQPVLPSARLSARVAQRKAFSPCRAMASFPVCPWCLLPVYRGCMIREVLSSCDSTERQGTRQCQDVQCPGICRWPRRGSDPRLGCGRRCFMRYGHRIEHMCESCWDESLEIPEVDPI